MAGSEIEITVETIYVKGHSDPEQSEYQFVYTITLTNRGEIGAQLKAPHGTMEGSYEWISDRQKLFRSPIAPFYLTVPRVLH